MSTRGFFGVLLSSVSVLVVLIITGSIGERGKYTDAALVARIGMDCPRLTDEDRMEVQAKAIILDDEKVALSFSAFGGELNRAERVRVVRACDAILYQFNFEPNDVRLPRPLDPPIRPKEANCPKGSPFLACFLVSGDTYQKSRGHLVVDTGQSARFESFGTRQIEIGIQSLLPETDITLEVSLPDGTFPSQVVPSPDHVIGSARTQLFFQSSGQFGPSAPAQDGRAIIETLGVKLQYLFPAKSKWENVILFIVSAICGIGATFLAEEFSASKRKTDQAVSLRK